MGHRRDGGHEYARLLAENERYTEAFDRSALTSVPLSGLAVVACMDARLDVEETLGLRTGDAHIIRNAGGLVTEDVIRSLIVSQRLGGTNEIVLIEHTGCGLHRADESRIRAGLDLPFEIGVFDDLEANLRRQVAILRQHPLLGRVPVHGLLFDVATGRLSEVS
jgi:carbonic anhydrase